MNRTDEPAPRRRQPSKEQGRPVARWEDVCELQLLVPVWMAEALVAQAELHGVTAGQLVRQAISQSLPGTTGRPAGIGGVGRHVE
jgi:hypothetical protein